MSTELEGSKWIWKDGEFIPWEDATLHRSVTAQKSFPGPEMACTQLAKARAIFPF